MDGDELILLILFGPSVVGVLAGILLITLPTPVETSAPGLPATRSQTLDYATPFTSEDTDVRRRRWILGTAGLLPVGLFALTGASVLAARLSNGEWPRPFRDPVSPLGDLACAWNCVCVLFQPLLLVIGMGLAAKFRQDRFHIGLAFLLYGCASLAHFAIAWFGPFAPWVLD